MFIFDTDHLGFLQLRQSAECRQIKQRMSKYRSQDFFVSIVSFHEQINGWTAFVARRKDTPGLVRGYEKLQSILTDFSEANVLAFNMKASEVYEDLRRQRIRIGAMDLRIAAIAIANQMTVLTRNTVDFERVPQLAFEDWTVLRDGGGGMRDEK